MPISIEQIPINFNPRSPRGLRRQLSIIMLILLVISIHAAQEGCDKWALANAYAYVISIHAAQEGCDPQDEKLRAVMTISIHAAQEGCDG